MINLLVLYPHPRDVDKFESDYAKHLKLLHEKTGIPKDQKPYTINKFVDSPLGEPAYYRSFSLPFESMEAIEAALASPGMQEVAADANRISTGGAPVILIGNSK